VMQLEATEDFHKMASVGTDSPEYAAIGLMDASVSLLYRKRIVWLVVLVFMNVFSGAGIAYFEDIIETNVALVFFLPLLIDSGVNGWYDSCRSFCYGSCSRWFRCCSCSSFNNDSNCHCRKFNRNVLTVCI